MIRMAFFFRIIILVIIWNFQTVYSTLPHVNKFHVRNYNNRLNNNTVELKYVCAQKVLIFGNFFINLYSMMLIASIFDVQVLSFSVFVFLRWMKN